MVPEIEPVLKALIEGGSSPIVQATAAFCTITGVNAINLVRGLGRHFRTEAELDSYSEKVSSQQVEEKLRNDLDNEDVMLNVILPAITAKEVRLLKAFHGLRPDMANRISTISDRLKKFDVMNSRRDDFYDLANDLVVTMKKNQRQPSYSAFEDLLFDFLEVGYVPLLNEHKEFVVEDGHTVTKNDVSECAGRLIQWREGHYQHKVSLWKADQDMVEKALFSWPSTKYKKLIKLNTRIKEGLGGELANYMNERTMFMKHSISVVSSLLRAVYFYGLTSSTNPKPIAGKLGDDEKRHLIGIQLDFTGDEIDATVNRSNHLILKLLEITIDGMKL